MNLYEYRRMMMLNEDPVGAAPMPAAPAPAPAPAAPAPMPAAPADPNAAVGGAAVDPNAMAGGMPQAVPAEASQMAMNAKQQTINIMQQRKAFNPKPVVKKQAKSKDNSKHHKNNKMNESMMKIWNRRRGY